MNERIKTLLIIAALALLAGGGAWLWFETMELQWEATPRQSDAARDNPMLAATGLLKQNGYQVTLADSLGALSVPALADGTLVVSNAYGVLAPYKAEQLLAWVRRGNTLVFQPRWINAAETKAYTAANGAAEDEEEEPEEETDEDADEEEDPATTDDSAEEEKEAPVELAEVDPLAARLGIRLHVLPEERDCDVPRRRRRASSPSAPDEPALPPGPCVDGKNKNRQHLSSVTVPGGAYALELGPRRGKLVSLPGATEPAWTDEHGTALRVYSEGKGRIVAVPSNYFGNLRLQVYDHGELLLALAALAPSAKQVTFVRNGDALPWPQALWQHFSHALIGLAAVLALLFWSAVRRFGPVLPEPDRERRSLLEHIDASGAWLWKADGGRQQLLDAARGETLALIKRRAPALLRLAPHDLCAALARMSGLPEREIDDALHAPAAPQAPQFIRQIRTLQELRNHHER